MAILNSSFYAKQVGEQHLQPQGVDAGGKLRIVTVDLSGISAIAAGDQIALAQLPAGARVLPAYSKVVAIASNLKGTSNKLKLGTADEADKFGTVAGAAAMNTAFTPKTGNIYPDALADGGVVYLTVTEALASGTGEAYVQLAFLSV